MNNSRGSFLDMEEEDLAVVILDYGDCWSLFEILDCGLFLTQEEKAVCVSSLPWLIHYRVTCENSVQVLIAISFGGDDCGQLNTSLMASSPVLLAWLICFTPLYVWLHTETQLILPYAVEWQRLPKKLSSLAKQFLQGSVTNCSSKSCHHDTQGHFLHPCVSIYKTGTEICCGSQKVKFKL